METGQRNERRPRGDKDGAKRGKEIKERRKEINDSKRTASTVYPE